MQGTTNMDSSSDEDNEYEATSMAAHAATVMPEGKRKKKSRETLRSSFGSSQLSLSTSNDSTPPDVAGDEGSTGDDTALMSEAMVPDETFSLKANKASPSSKTPTSAVPRQTESNASEETPFPASTSTEKDAPAKDSEEKPKPKGKRGRTKKDPEQQGLALSNKYTNARGEMVKYETVKEKEPQFVIGKPVYAPFPGRSPNEESFYWGRIAKKLPNTKSPKSMGKFRYLIDFDDGDKSEEPIEAFWLHTMEEQISLAVDPRIFMPNKPPRRYLEDWDKERYGPPGDLVKLFQGLSATSPRNGNTRVASGPAAASIAAAATTACQTDQSLIEGEGWSLQELFEKRCKNCSQCNKVTCCQACPGCQYSQENELGPNEKRQVCVKKMCCNIRRADKVQRSKFLPTNWFYCFEEKNNNPEYDGLVITSKGYSVKKYVSFERASKAAPTQFSDHVNYVKAFYRSVGLIEVAERLGVAEPSAAVSSQATLARNPAPHEAANRPWSLKEIYEARCGKCQSCKRKICDKCSLCRQTKRGIGCLRRMCEKIPRIQKQQKTRHLPKGFSYFFSVGKATGHSRTDDLDGLVIRAPSGEEFYSVESAMSKLPDAFTGHRTAAKDFYEYLGISGKGMEAEKAEGHCKQSPRVSSSPSNREAKRRRGETKDGHPLVITIDLSQDAVITDNIPTMSIESSLGTLALRRRRCRNCVMCRRKDCGKCSSCIINQGRSTRYPEACLRKICVEFDHNEKRQLASGFTKGWTFYFLPPEEDSGPVVHEELRGLRIFSPENEEFASIEEALNRCAIPSTEVHKRRADFCRQIGASLRIPKEKHDLLGKSFLREWLRSDGSRAWVTGQITAVEDDKVQGREVFVVSHHADSLSIVNNPSNGGRLNVPAIKEYEEWEAWDGCIGALIDSGQSPVRLESRARSGLCRWKIPKSLHRGMAAAKEPVVPGFRELPYTILVYKGYILTLKVKKSTITNGGFGLFLSIKPRNSNAQVPDHFHLENGHLLDFGIYAPHRDEDRRGDHEHMVKSIIFMHKNEAYCFESHVREIYLDITDNTAGSLHAEARKHVAPFVNEVDTALSIAQVHARTDPEGSLHYLLGHAEKKDGPFLFPADGSDREIFVNYGEEYEIVRMREGYARKALDDAATKQILENEEQEFLKELDTFTAEEVDHFVRVFRPMLTCTRQFDKDVLLRLMAVTLLLMRRAMSMRDEFLDLGDNESFCDNGATTLDLDALVTSLRHMIQEECDGWRLWHGPLVSLLREASALALFRNAFATVFPPPNSIDRLSPNEFCRCLSMTKYSL